MTRLRKMMLEELERRNYSEATTRCYIRTVEDFSRRFKRSPDGLGPEHIREYQAELFKKRKLSPGTVTQRLAALRFFYIKTLKKTWSIAETPYPKKAFHLPSILSREEVARLIDAALTPYHRTLLMTLYAKGKFLERHFRMASETFFCVLHAAKCSNASEFVSAFLTVPGYLVAYFTSFCLSKDRSSISSRCGVSPLCSVR